MKNRKLKTTAEYPQLYCRIKSEDKVEIEKLLSEILESARLNTPSGYYKPKRNEYLVKGLKRGLKSLLKEKNKCN